MLCCTGMSLAWLSLGQLIYSKRSESTFLPHPQKVWNEFISTLCSFSSQFLFFLKVLPPRHFGLRWLHWFLTPAASQNLLAQMVGLRTLKFLAFSKQLRVSFCKHFGGGGIDVQQRLLNDGAGRQPLHACLNTGIQATGHNWGHIYS